MTSMMAGTAEVERTALVAWADCRDVNLADAPTRLSRYELDRMARLARPADRRRFVAAWSLVRQMMSDRLGLAPQTFAFDRRCHRCEADHGKPRLVGFPNWDVSISHSENAVVAAVTNGFDVGVDVELVPSDERIADIASQVLSPQEQAQSAADLMRTWVRKEALLKATGDGLSTPMPDLTVSAPDQDASLLHWKHRSELVLHAVLADLDAPNGYIAALALIPKQQPGKSNV